MKIQRISIVRILSARTIAGMDNIRQEHIFDELITDMTRDIAEKILKSKLPIATKSWNTSEKNDTMMLQIDLDVVMHDEAKTEDELKKEWE